MKRVGLLDIEEPFAGLFTQGMVCHETYRDPDGVWLTPEEVHKGADGGLLAADGRPRAAYAAFLRRCGVDPLAPSGAALAALEGAPFGDRLRIFPVPLVIPEREYGEVLAGGVRQRARALQDFFADMVLGAQRILSPDGPLPAREVRAVWDDEGLGLVRPLDDLDLHPRQN